MKCNFKIIIIFISLFFCHPVLAGNWVIGGSLPLVKNSNEDNSLNQQFEDAGLNATAQTKDSIKVVLQAFGGYDFNNRWGIELGYINLGKVETTFTGSAVDIETFLNTVENIHPQTAQGWIVSANHYIPLDRQNRIKIRIGSNNWSANYTLKSGSTSRQVKQDGTELSYAIGIEAGWCKRRGAYGHLKWENHLINDKNVGILGLGVSYCF